ncbi:MAG: hypothetical protein ACI8QZ_003461 [Chlamydiales bacterium]
MLPKSVQLTEFRVERTDSGAQLAISGAIPKSTTSFGDRLAALARALGTSPFFHTVQILDAETPEPSEPGSFKATLQVAAGLPLPWEEQR